MATAQWYVAPSGSGTSVYEADDETGADRLIADVYGGDEAGAMIAAVPDLLEALEGLVDAISNAGKRPTMVRLEAAYAAIAKAKGA